MTNYLNNEKTNLFDTKLKIFICETKELYLKTIPLKL